MNHIKLTWPILRHAQHLYDDNFLRKLMQFHLSYTQSRNDTMQEYIFRRDFSLKKTTFWYMTPCSLLKVNLRFGEIYRLHLHGRRISRVRYQRATCFDAGILFGLFLEPEHRGDMFLRNVGLLSIDYLAYNPRR
jgi:hypothetical protein